jgi:hypothetical protein
VHPWRLTEKALKSAGLFDKFDKPTVNTPAVNSTSTDRKAYLREYIRKRRAQAAPRAPRIERTSGHRWDRGGPPETRPRHTPVPEMKTSDGTVALSSAKKF